MSIQLDTATVIALIAESVFFGELKSYYLLYIDGLTCLHEGIFTVLFSISMFILVLRRRQSHRMNKPIITVSVLMYLLGLAVSNDVEVTMLLMSKFCISTSVLLRKG